MIKMGILDEIGFTPEKYHELKKQKSDMEIAEDELGVSDTTLQNWKNKHGVKGRKCRSGKEFTKEEWEAKRKEGLTEHEIAEYFGYKTLAIYFNYKKSLGIPNRIKKIERTPELLAEIEKYLGQGVSIKEITEKLSVKMTSMTVRRIIKEEGLRDGKPDHKKHIRENRKPAEKGA